MSMVGDRQGKCVNIGNCGLADKREPVVAKAGQDFVCPECGKSLIAAMPAATAASPKRNAVWVIAIVVLLLLVGGGLLLRGKAPAESARQTETVQPGVSAAMPPVPAVTAPAAAAAPAVPATEGGDCSATHGQAGLCAKSR